MNLADPELELIDPTPDIHSLFLHFDKLFFWSRLANRVAVRWSKRMYSCAGVCSYECRSRFCDLALSEPLLKLRPRKDLVETLLHEMIHAYLFVTCQDQDRDGHGPNFKEHMYRINKLAGVNITIYHDFHDEVKLYQTHWWRCNGPCQTRKPYFGIVRRSANKAPGPNDYWWKRHQATCGGTFVKIKEPAKSKSKSKEQTKSKENITKFINNNNKDLLNKNIPTKLTQPAHSVLKDKNKEIVISNGIIKNQNNNNNNVLHKGNIFSTQVNKNLSPTSDSRRLIDNVRKSPQSDDVIETVRNIWANKQVPNIHNAKINISKYTKPSPDRNINVRSSNKHKSRDSTSLSPPSKIKKIDDYFKKIATSVLKDVYGEDFKIIESETDKKLIASKAKMVECPICNIKVKDDGINTHLDECLNKDVIENLSRDTKKEVVPIASKSKEDKTNVRKSGNFVKIEPRDNEINNSVSSNNYDVKAPVIKIEPGCSKDIESISVDTCPCCGQNIDKSVAEHLDECLSFFDNNTTIPQEGASTSFITETIVIDDDDDDIFDESQTLNATGTKFPCPCCLKMVEQMTMNDHLDICLSS